jgi:tetratricopeptide (TPR) repeat protein
MLSSYSGYSEFVFDLEHLNMGISTTSTSLLPTTPQQAGKVISNVLSTNATIHRLWFARGKILTKQGYYESALTSFDAALRFQSNHHQTWVFRGVVLTHLQRYKSALVSFERALELEPGDREAWIFRGAVLSYLEHHHEAMNSYTRALQIQRREAKACQDYPLWMPTTIHQGLTTLTI